MNPPFRPAGRGKKGQGEKEGDSCAGKHSPPPDGHFSLPDDHFPAADEDFSPADSDFSLPDEDFSPADGDFSPADGDFSLPDALSSTRETYFSLPDEDFSPADGDFSLPDALFSTRETYFSLPDGHFSPADGHFSPADGHFSLPDGHFSLPDGHFSPADGHFSQADGHFSPADDDFSPPDGHFSPADGRSTMPDRRLFRSDPPSFSSMRLLCRVDRRSIRTERGFVPAEDAEVSASFGVRPQAGPQGIVVDPCKCQTAFCNSPLSSLPPFPPRERGVILVFLARGLRPRAKKAKDFGLLRLRRAEILDGAGGMRGANPLRLVESATGC